MPHVLTGGGDVTVINVFAGIPAHGDKTGSWDCLTRASDSAARVRERLDEDVEALALAGVESVNLDLLDSQYRSFGSPPAAADALAEPLPGAEIVYAPAAPRTIALGGHVDAIVIAARRMTMTSIQVPASYW